MFGTITDKKIVILGFSFKANTNDTRESPSKYVCQKLLEEGSKLAIYDPKVSAEQIKKDLDQEVNLNDEYSKNHIEIFDSIKESVTGADAIVVMTDWEEFKLIDWEDVSNLMRSPSWLFDTRSICDIEKAKISGLNIWRIGYGKKDK